MKRLISALFIVILMVGGCSVFKKNDKKLNIITTIPPLYSLTANLVEGVEVNLTNIVPPNTTVHAFQLSPSVVRALADADLVVTNGVELEHFLDDSLVDLDAHVVDSSVNVELLSFVDNHHDEHGVFDPHIWLSPKNAKIQAENILGALLAVDSEHADIYRKNFMNLSGRLDRLDSDLKERFSSLDMGHYLVFHDAYQYFDQNFGLKATAYLEKFPGKEPSLKYLSEVVGLIREKSIEAIFTEPQFSPKLVKSLSSDYDLKVAELDPLGQNVSKDGYFELLWTNYREFERVFNKK